MPAPFARGLRLSKKLRCVLRLCCPLTADNSTRTPRKVFSATHMSRENAGLFALLASPLGRGVRAQRGRRGQTMTIQKACNPLSVTCGDSSPKGRAETVEKASLRSAPLLSADSGQFDAHSTQSVFCHAHVAAENELHSFRVCGRETLRGFLTNETPPGEIPGGVFCFFGFFTVRSGGRPEAPFP